MLLVGRTINCAAGSFAQVAEARNRGARLVFVDPRMPEGALAESEWVPIKPGVDAAFLHGLIHVGLKEKLADFEWMRAHTNAPYLVRDDLTPITEADLRANGRKRAFAVIDERTSGVAFMGLKLNDKNQPVAYDESPDVRPALFWQGEVTLLSGERVTAKTVLQAFSDVNAKYAPDAVAALTGVPAARIVEIARDFFRLKGVCDDGWYSSRNGNDVEGFALQNILNLLTGRFDRKGGLIRTQGGGFGGGGVKKAGTKCSGPTGETWEVAPGKPLDKMFFPEGIGTLSATFEAMKTGKPYPVRALIMTGCAMFHREANSARLIEAFKSLELVISQDLLPSESNDWADYVLPSTYFLENPEYLGVSYARDGWVQKSDSTIDPPEGVEARHDIWQLLEILRRMYPERAARAGYTAEIKTRAEWLKWFNEGLMNKAWAKFIAGKNNAKPGLGDRIAKDVEEKGCALVTPKPYETFTYRAPLWTPTGKAELVSFYVLGAKTAQGIMPLPEYAPTKSYTAPKPVSDEFIIVSGKNGASCSGLAMFTFPSKYTGDRTIWMNPVDAERLGIETGDMIECEGLDTGVKGVSAVTVTNRVMAGVLFSYGFSAGVRTKKLLPAYEWVREGLNTQWLSAGISQVACGNLNNNVSVRVRRIGKGA